MSATGATGGPHEPRVTLLTGEYPPAVGGVGDYTATLAARLRRLGVAVAVVTGSGAPMANDLATHRTVHDSRHSWPSSDAAPLKA